MLKHIFEAWLITFMGYGAGTPDPETGCGLQSTGEKARLLIGRAR